MSDEDWTRKRIQKFFKSTGMTQQDFAKYVGVNSASVASWVSKTTLTPRTPNHVRTKKCLDDAWIRWQKDPETTTVEEETVEGATPPVEETEAPALTTEAIRGMWKASGLSQGEFANKLGISTSAFSHWCNGAHLPKGKNAERLRHWLKHQPLSPRTKPDRASPEPTEIRRPRRTIAVESVLEITSKFQQKYRVDYNRRYSNDILGELEQETGVARHTLRLIICVWAALMKDRFASMEDAFNVVSGSESSD